MEWDSVARAMPMNGHGQSGGGSGAKRPGADSGRTLKEISITGCSEVADESGAGWGNFFRCQNSTRERTACLRWVRGRTAEAQTPQSRRSDTAHGVSRLREGRCGDTSPLEWGAGDFRAPAWAKSSPQSGQSSLASSQHGG